MVFRRESFIFYIHIGLTYGFSCNKHLLIRAFSLFFLRQQFAEGQLFIYIKHINQSKAIWPFSLNTAFVDSKQCFVFLIKLRVVLFALFTKLETLLFNSTLCVCCCGFYFCFCFLRWIKTTKHKQVLLLLLFLCTQFVLIKTKSIVFYISICVFVLSD